MQILIKISHSSERYIAQMLASIYKAKKIMMEGQLYLDDWMYKTRLKLIILPQRALLETCYSRNIFLGPILQLIFIIAILDQTLYM